MCPSEDSAFGTGTLVKVEQEREGNGCRSAVASYLGGQEKNKFEDT